MRERPVMADPYDDDDEPDELDEDERALSECGQTPDAGCLMAGTEYCDFECPFRDMDLFSDDDDDFEVSL